MSVTGSDASTDPDGSSSTEGQDPASAAAPPSRRAALLRSGFIVGVLLVVFLVIIPRFVDYSEVADAFRDLTLPQVLLMTVLGAIAWLISGQLFTVLTEGLSVIQGGASYLILSGIGSSVPFGPWNMGVVWVVVRGWGVGVQPATSGIALYGVINQLGRLALPLVATVVLIATGGLNQTGGTAFVITVISIVVFVVATGLIAAVVRSDRVADWLGRTGQRVVSWLLARLGRTGAPDVSASVHRFRDQLGAVIQRRGLAALIVSVIAQLAWCVVLIVALRVVGVPEGVLPPADVLAVFALVSVITIIPISPGGAGVPELLYIAGLSAIAGPSYESIITAGVFLFRLYQWFLPIPIAWILLKIARRGRSILPTTSELRSYAKG
ncbi:MAG: YbhN family protein [Candidatus Limnocylindrales bacterium]